MKKTLKVCIVAENYPTKEQPMFPFVQQLAYSLSNENCTCCIIAPQSVTHSLIRGSETYPVYSEDISPDGKKICVYRPKIVTFSNAPVDIVQKLANKLFQNAVRKSLKKIGKVDIVYSYFWHVGLNVVQACGKQGNPMLVQASECGLTVNPWQITPCNLSLVKGVVCASNKNLQESLNAGLAKKEQCRTIVNGYRADEFYPMDRSSLRREQGFDKDAFIIAFVGFFIERKGMPQLCKALDSFDDVKSIFIGQGPILPTCKNVIFQGKLPHNEIVRYMNCADVFVLPTNAEGCCNAIIEALACGLPVISSDKSFNDEILDETCSIRIDESSAEQIETAIRRLKEDPVLRKEMSRMALKKAASLTIEQRAAKIRKFFDEILEKEQKSCV